MFDIKYSFCFSGIKKGERVAIYMPMIVELVVAMLACARIGAIHSIVVGSHILLDFTEEYLRNKSGAGALVNPVRTQHSNLFDDLQYILYLLQFGGFSAESLKERILDSSCKMLITAGEQYSVSYGLYCRASMAHMGGSCVLVFGGRGGGGVRSDQFGILDVCL